jgi:hypothetical protein
MKAYRDTVLGSAPAKESKEQKNTRAADVLMREGGQEAEADGSLQHKRGREQPLSPVMQAHGDMGEREATRARQGHGRHISSPGVRHRSGASKQRRSKKMSDGG